MIAAYSLSCLLQPKEAWDYENVEEKRADAEKLKERGTVYFKAEKFGLALKLYSRYLLASFLAPPPSPLTQEKKLHMGGEPGNKDRSIESLL